MGDVVLFRPQASLTAEKNLARYIDLAKNKITLWSHFPGFNWSYHAWQTPLRKIRFLNLKGRKIHKSKAPRPDDLMETEFGNFARAYIRYTQHIKPTQTFPRSILALQLLEEAMIRLDGHAFICNAEHRHFETAGNILLEENIQDRSGVGGALEVLSMNISSSKLTTNRIIWKHPFVGKLSNPGAPENLNQEQKEAKLPSSDAIWAVAEIFANGYKTQQDDEDIFITGTTALLMSFPVRIGELAFFRTTPHSYELNKNGEPELILKGFSPKTKRFMVKAVIDVVAPVTEEAISRLQEITTEGRRLAIYLESGNPRFYRHDTCPDVADDTLLTPTQVKDALGLKSIGSAETFLLQYTGHYSLSDFTLNLLWEIVLKHNQKLNPNFPFQAPETKGRHRLKMSESLMCLRYNQLSSTLSTSPVLLVPYNRDYYSKRMTNEVHQRGAKEVTMSFFHKHHYGDIKLNSHQFRHLLNTMAQQAGVSIQTITDWSTRASTRQSATYMHENPERTAQRIAENRIPAINIVHQPVTPEEYRNSRPKGPTIVTPFGICNHNYTVSHCNKFNDCLNCSELILCKGHKRSIKEIEFERDSIKENLDAAFAEIQAGNRAADRWYDSHYVRYHRYVELVKVMTAPEITDGTPIKNVGLDFSHEQRIIQKIAPAALEISMPIADSNLSDDVLDCLKLLMEENNASTNS
jgi:hypothetical protein